MDSFLEVWEGKVRGGRLCIVRRSGLMDEIELMCWDREDCGNQSLLYILHITRISTRISSIDVLLHLRRCEAQRDNMNTHVHLATRVVPLKECLSHS